MSHDQHEDNSPDCVLSERRGAVQIITFNRPARLNAWSEALESRYFDLLEEADTDSRVRAIVITGSGRGFCSGALISDLDTSTAGGVDQSLADLVRPRHLPMLIRKPTVAAINGAAVGLGLVEALYCDVRFCVPGAKISTMFARRGLIAEYGTSWLLPRLVGRSRAFDLLLSGRFIDGHEAAAIGLVDRVVTHGSVVEAAIAYANDLAKYCSPGSMAAIKSQINRDADATFAQALAAADRLMAESFTHPDSREGVVSYIEQRPPAFQPLPARSNA